MLREAPLSRTIVDEAQPWLRGVLGLAFVAYSASSTIFYAGADLLFLFLQTRQITIGGFADAYWYAIGLAATLFVGQVATGEQQDRGAYRAFLGPDIFYTARGLHPGLAAAFAVLLGAFVPILPAASIIGWLVAWPVALFIGYHIARWGEVLLFGRRRQFRRRRSGSGKDTEDG